MAALELRHILRWFPDDRDHILNSARQQVAYMKNMYLTMDAEKASEKPVEAVIA